MSSNRNLGMRRSRGGNPGWTEDDWNRLSQRLYERRIELDPRYITFQTFVEERADPTLYRTLWDAEHAVEQNRTNITLGTLMLKVDPAYGWELRSSETILNGGQPVPLPGTPGARRKRASAPPPPADMTPEELAAKFVEFLEQERLKEEGRGERSA